MIELSDHDTHIYSPEDSDTHPWGDWQTKVTAGAMLAVLCALVFLVAQ